jgi:hypothetical protein
MPPPSLGEALQIGLLRVAQPALRQRRGRRPRSPPDRRRRQLEFARDNVGHATLAVVVLAVALQSENHKKGRINQNTISIANRKVEVTKNTCNTLLFCDSRKHDIPGSDPCRRACACESPASSRPAASGAAPRPPLLPSPFRTCTRHSRADRARASPRLAGNQESS